LSKISMSASTGEFLSIEARTSSSIGLDESYFQQPSEVPLTYHIESTLKLLLRNLYSPQTGTTSGEIHVRNQDNIVEINKSRVAKRRKITDAFSDIRHVATEEIGMATCRALLECMVSHNCTVVNQANSQHSDDTTTPSRPRTPGMLITLQNLMMEEFLDQEPQSEYNGLPDHEEWCHKSGNDTGEPSHIPKEMLPTTSLFLTCNLASRALIKLLEAEQLKESRDRDREKGIGHGHGLNEGGDRVMAVDTEYGKEGTAVAMCLGILEACVFHNSKAQVKARSYVILYFWMPHNPVSYK